MLTRRMKEDALSYQKGTSELQRTEKPVRNEYIVKMVSMIIYSHENANKLIIIIPIQFVNADGKGPT